MSEPDVDVLTDTTDSVAVAVPASDAAGTTQAETPTRGEREAAARMGLPARLGRLDYKWVALAVVLGGSIMTILDATVVNVAIPSLQQALHAGSYNDIAWVVTGYMLAQGAVIPMTGWATDRFGTKRLYLITLVLFTAASMACGLSWNLGSLILFRVLQGIGGGMLMPIGMTIILRAVGPQEMGRVMGVFGVPMLLGPAIGPVLGGWFVQDFSWRLIFYINVPIGVVALFAAWRLLVETPVEHKLKLDVPGLLTGIPAVCALMFGVDRSTTLGWGSPLVVTMLVASAVLFAVFVVRQRTTDEPLLHLRLFNDTTFTMSVLLSLVMVTALFGAMFLLPVYLQQVHGYDAITTGLLLMPQAVTAAIMMPIGGHLSDRIGPRPTVLIGLVALAAGSIMLAQVHAYSPLLLVVAAMGVRGIAMGFSMMPSMAAGLARIPRESTSRASSITNTVQRAGSSVALAVLVTVLAAQAATGASQASCEPSPRVLAAAAAAHLPGTRDGLCGALVQRAGSFSTDATAKPAQSVSDPTLAAFLKDYRDEAASITFDRIFALLAIVAVAGAIPALFLRRPGTGRAGRGGVALD